MFELNRSLDIPLYRQVEMILEEKIKSGEWEKGFQIPAEQELADQFQVSNITVKRAVLELVDKGLVFRQRGKGSFVSNIPKEQNILSFITLTTENHSHPHELLSFAIEAAGPAVSNYLQVSEETKVVKIKRLNLDEGEPAAIEYTYLPHSLCPDLTPEHIENDLIYNLLKNKYQIPLGKARLRLKPYIVDEEEAKLLQVKPGSSLFDWERITFSKEGKIVEYSKFQIRPDKEFYSIDVDL
jgi:GntR family transcriptional regulator